MLVKILSIVDYTYDKAYKKWIKEKTLIDVLKDVEEVVAKWVENNPQAILESVQNMYKKAQEEQQKNAQKNIGVKKDELFNSKDRELYSAV